MPSAAARRSDRVSLTLLLETTGTDRHGHEFRTHARTLVISRGGAVIVLDRELQANQEIHIQRKAPKEVHRQARARIVREIGRDRDGFLYGIEIIEATDDPWAVEFPDAPDAGEAFSRMLLECSYCGSREVVHVSELELRAFENNRGIARHCKTCRVPSIWIQAPNEDEKKLAKRKARKPHAEEPEMGIPADEKRERQRVRLQTRLTACVRQSGADDELALCEDISPLGLCFRSKRRYEPEELVDVAVPYSPEAANIFLPARIIYSEEIPKAGMFRHGTEYRRVGPRAR
jgi:hypothetical protein